MDICCISPVHSPYYYAHEIESDAWITKATIPMRVDKAAFGGEEDAVVGVSTVVVVGAGSMSGFLIHSL